MSKNRSDSYVRFGSYNQNEKIQQEAPHDGRFANAPPPQDNRFANAPPQDNRFANAPPPQDGRFANVPPPQAQDARPANAPLKHRVREIESIKLYELLSSPAYHFTSQKKPSKIFVKVYTDWCAPCKKIEPFIQALSVHPSNNDILFVQINGEKICEKLSKIIKVGAVPVFFGFIKGVQAGDFVAGADEAQIKELCSRLAMA